VDTRFSSNVEVRLAGWTLVPDRLLDESTDPSRIILDSVICDRSKPYITDVVHHMEEEPKPIIQYIWKTNIENGLGQRQYDRCQ
jgi:hypothetical protein